MVGSFIQPGRNHPQNVSNPARLQVLEISVGAFSGFSD